MNTDGSPDESTPTFACPVVTVAAFIGNVTLGLLVALTLACIDVLVYNTVAPAIGLHATPYAFAVKVSVPMGAR